MHFKHSMEEGGWDLSKVDMEELADSKATFVFGQMNEPPGARARVALIWFDHCRILSVMVMDKEKDVISCSSLIISSVLHRPVLKYQPC